MKTTVLLFIGAFGTSANLLWAVETADPAAFTMEQMLGPLANLGGMGFVVWLAWYTLTKTLPFMATEHKNTVEKLATKFEESLAKTTDDAKGARAELRDALHALTTAQANAAAEHRQAIDKLAATVLTMVQQCTSRGSKSDMR